MCVDFVRVALEFIQMASSFRQFPARAMRVWMCTCVHAGPKTAPAVIGETGAVFEYLRFFLFLGVRKFY